MSIPYLNRGESIVLTTHRVSTGSVLYDAMLTNQRLILMDSQYNQSGPEMIPFSDIVTVKGGKASTSEPAIILTLKEPNDFSDSPQVSLIFTQNPNEKRRHERELWVKKLIELVIRAREEEAQSTVVPVVRKNGLQPSVRRWEAPEPVRPRSSIAEPAPPVAEPVIITEQEPDSLEFFLEGKNRDRAGEQKPGKGGETARASDMPAAEAPPVESPPPAEETREDTLSGQEPLPEPEPSPVTETVPQDPFAGIHIPLPRDEPEDKPEPVPAQDGLIGNYPSHEPFDDIVRAAASSLKVTRNPPEPESHPGEIPVVRKTTPIPDRSPEVVPVALPVRQTPGEKRELPGTYAPEVTATPIPPAPKKRDPPSGNRGKKPRESKSPVRKFPVGAVIITVIAIIAILAVAAFAANALFSSPYSNTVITITPSAGSNPTPVQVPADLQPAGVYVRVIYPNDFVGSVGNPGLLHQVSGRGNQTFSVLMTKSIVQATIRKLDNSPEPLTVEIYNNTALLAGRTVTAPHGEVSLLIDATTAAAPGMGAGQTPASERPLLGNGSLIYY